MRSFFGVTTHYIVNDQLHKCMLSCSRFKGSHTGDNIYDLYLKVVQDYDIEDKVSRIVTDNAANMLKAFNCEEDDVHDYEAFDNSLDENSENAILDYIPITHTTCFAHTLQLVVKDGFAQAVQARNVISKAGRFVAFTHRSTKATEILEDSNRLAMANSTLWYSQLHMLKSILKVPKKVLDQIDHKDKLSNSEMKLIEDLCTIMQPFEDATDGIQGNCKHGYYMYQGIETSINVHKRTRTSETNCTVKNTSRIHKQPFEPL